MNIKIRKKLQEIFYDQRGSLIMVTVLIMTGVLTISLGAASLVMSGLVMNRTQSRSTQAFFASEAGIERILNEIRTNNFDPGSVASCDLLSGSVYIDFNTMECVSDYDLARVAYPVLTYGNYYLKWSSSSPMIFQSVGEFRGTIRKIEISY